MAQRFTAEQYMSSDLVTFSPAMDLRCAIRLLKVAFSASYHQEWGGHVAQVMSREVQTVEAQSDVVEVAGLFLNSRFRRFPVMKNGRLVGVISRHDVLRALDDLW
jgi:CBS domain-containing protein